MPDHRGVALFAMTAYPGIAVPVTDGRRGRDEDGIGSSSARRRSRGTDTANPDRLRGMKAPAPRRQAAMVRPRVQIGESIAIGPGKIALLREVAAARSISGAARALGMTYKRAWLLIDTLNRGFGRPVVETSAGGRGGGGARLTPLGEALVSRYLALEDRVNATCRAQLAALRRLAR